MDKDKRTIDMEVSCHDCGCRWSIQDGWELNCEPKVYSAPDFLKRVCNACYHANGQSLSKRGGMAP